MKTKKTKKRVYRDYNEVLYEFLQDPQEAVMYLQACLDDEDPRVFLSALRNVLEARKRTVAELAEKTDLNKQNLYRMLSDSGNPRYTSLRTVLHSMGFGMSINLLKK